MSTATTTDQNLDTCGCCTTDTGDVPPHYNRAGLSRLAYRAGTHSDFLRRLLHRLPYQALPDGDRAGARPLAGLTTRSTDDPSVALLDAWAMSLDVLAFYQEQIANEGFLRTAGERSSVLELARMIGYELNPGVAATTFLAFRLDAGPRSPSTQRLPPGIRVMSVPVRDELPQKFETVEEVEVRPAWNAMTPRQQTVPGLTDATVTLPLAGVGLGLQKGDQLLIVDEERFDDPSSTAWIVAPLASVVVDAEQRITIVTFDRPLGVLRGEHALPAAPRLFALRDRMNLFGYNAPDMRAMSQSTRGEFGNARDWPGLSVDSGGPFDLGAEYPRIVPGSWMVVTGLAETRGHDGETSVAPAVRLYRVGSVGSVARTDFSLVNTVTRVTPAVAPSDPRVRALPLVGAPAGTAGGGPGSAPMPEALVSFLIRGTRVLGNSEELSIAALTDVTPVAGDVLVLADVVLGLTPGRRIIVTGRRPRMTLLAEPIARGGGVLAQRGDVVQVLRPGVTISTGEDACSSVFRWAVRARGGTAGTIDAGACAIAWSPPLAEDETISEIVRIRSITVDNAATTITLTQPLENIFDRATMRVLGNVARVTHGETFAEEIGSGNGTQMNQRFTLKKPPLTHVAATNAQGSASTLEVRVNGVLWSQVPWLYGQGPRSEVYIVRINNEGKASVIFGDGRQGARLPSGEANVRAVYRSGIGLDGEVPAETLTVMQTRPLGVAEVTNPVAADGAASPEQIEDARRNAPTTVMTFERVVSLRDFEDFARAFAGVSKAQAAILWNGATQIVHLTVAASGGRPAGAELRRNLRVAIDGLRDSTIDMVIDGYDDRRFAVAARVVVDGRYLAETVLANVRAALTEAFSFERREFAQAVASSDVIRVIQRVEGVAWVDLDALYVVTTSVCGGASSGLNDVLPAARARWMDRASLRACIGRAALAATGGLLPTGYATAEAYTRALIAAAAESAAGSGARAGAGLPDDAGLRQLLTLGTQGAAAIVRSELLLIDPDRITLYQNHATQ